MNSSHIWTRIAFSLVLAMASPMVNSACGQFVAFNDHSPGSTTHPNATTWNIFGNAPGAGGALKDIATGASLTATVTITRSGTVDPANVGSNPNIGTPLYNTFHGYVDFGAGNSDSIAGMKADGRVTYTFTGLKTDRLYSFKSGVVRAASGGDYPQRWTIATLNDAIAFTPAHSSGCYTNGLPATQAAFNSGINLVGDMIDFETIVPSATGSFSVTCQQYFGAIPSGTAGGTAAYALTGFRLEESGPPPPAVPTVASIANVGSTGVRVIYSMAVDAPSATNLANYALTNLSGSTLVTGASMVDSKTVQLTTATQSPYATYWLTISNVLDAATGSLPIVSGTKAIFTNTLFSFGYVKRELYFNINGTSIASLQASPNFPGNPSAIDYLPSTAWPIHDIADNYGARLSGILVPQISGVYYFAVSSDDTSRLYLSSSENPLNKVLRSEETTWGGDFDSHTSTPITLSAGKHYYLEALFKEGTGDDYLNVAWKTPSNPTWSIIPADCLGGYAASTNGNVVILRQPADTLAIPGTTATFGVVARGSSSVTTNLSFQWQLNGVDIPGAIGPSYTTGVQRESDPGGIYRVLVYLPGQAVYSTNAVLTIAPDTQPPVVVRVSNIGNDTVQIVYSEPMDPVSVTTISNYTFSNNISAQNAVWDASTFAVKLSVTGMIPGQTCTVSITGVQDQARKPNPIAPNTSATFFVSPFTSQIVGPVSPAGDIRLATGGYDVTAAGGDLVGLVDRFQFGYQRQSGDFDIAARVNSFTGYITAKAGLMARDSLGANGRFAAVFTSPGFMGSYFCSRSDSFSSPTTSGNLPVNYPNEWLRLRRVGNQFTGYVSYDGLVWQTLGTATMNLTDPIYFGMAAATANTNTPAIAQFRDLHTATNAIDGLVSMPNEPLGPSSRRTGLVISEIMYHPAPRADGRNLEFIEIYNSQSIREDISQYQLAGSIDYTFPANTVIGPGAFVVVAKSPADLAAVYGLTGVYGPFANSLPNGGGEVQLRNNVGAILLDVNYQDEKGWPLAADGAGHSLVLANPSYGEDDPRAWSISDLKGGSPGTWNGATRAMPVKINEVLLNAASGQTNFVELYNQSSASVDLSGCWLSNDPATNQFRLPQGTVIGPGQFLAFVTNTVGFSLPQDGAEVYLVDPGNSRVIDAVRVGPQWPGYSFGRFPDGGSQFYELASPTPSAHNASWRLSDVVINEIMYAPISGIDDDQYIELYNRGTRTINMSGWKISGAVSYQFPTNALLPTNGYLVVARNAGRLMTNYSTLNARNTFGNFNGKLPGSGDRLALQRPLDLVSFVGNNKVTNRVYVVENELSYCSGGRWGDWSKGGGSSLELVDPLANNRLPANWADSDESAKSLWTTVEYTGPIGETLGSPINDNLEVFLCGVGEALVDDVEVRNNGGANLLTNPGFESSAGWYFQGSHDQSSIQTTGGCSGPGCLHLRAASRGDNGANRIRSSAIAASGAVTLRCKARWLRGWPELLLRVHGGGIEAFGKLPVPANLGTPGAANSRRNTSNPPAIYDVAHSPILPAAGQNVVVTAKVDAPRGLASMIVNYRIEPSTTASVTMNDAGINGDAVAGDGIYSATLPGQASGAMVAFSITARDLQNNAGTFPASTAPAGAPRLFPSDSVSHECLVRFGETQMPGGFATYHVWTTTANRDRWASRDPLNNAPVDITFVYNNTRVIYNADGYYNGSPWHRGLQTTGPDGANRCDYTIELPEDDRFLGDNGFVIDLPGNSSGSDSSDPSGLGEQLCHLIFREMGLPIEYRRYIHVFVNGSQRSQISTVSGNFVLEDTPAPNGAFLKEWFPNQNQGSLYKLNDWFEFSDNGFDFSSNNDADFQRRLIPGATNINLAPYRFMWQARGLNPGDSANDYSAFLALLDAITPAADSEPVNLPVFDSLANLDQWMAEIACQRTVGNFDAYGYQRGKNNYLFKPDNGRAVILPWDVDWMLGLPGSTDSSAGIYDSPSDPRVGVMFQTIPIQRKYLRAYLNIIRGPLRTGHFDAVIDERLAAFQMNNVSYDGNAVSTIRTYLANRRSSIESQIASAQVYFGLTSAQTNTVATNCVTLTGTAPLTVDQIQVNGESCPIAWTALSTWSIRVALKPGANVLNIVALDTASNTVATARTVAMFNGAIPSPAGLVVINEIMCAPVTNGAEFVELYNASSTTTFDLSGWEFKGLSYTFPSGSIIAPQSFLVLAANRSQFAKIYGATIPVFDTFGGSLQPDGETLTLLSTNAAPSNLVARVRYSTSAPWPAGAIGAGKSLQLIDAAQDNWRAGNWAVATATPAAVNSAARSLTAFPPLWINELQADNLTGIANRAGQRAPWIELYNPTANSVALGGLCLSSSYTNLTNWTFPAGYTVAPGQFKVVFADGLTNLSTAAEPHAGFSLAPGAGSLALSRLASGQAQILDYIDYTHINPNRSYGSLPDGQAFNRQEFFIPTPGVTNNGASATLPVVINEWMASNTNTVVDPVTGKYDDWFELFNTSTNRVDISGYYLTDDPTNHTKFKIPAGYTIAPRGFLLVWADKKSTNATPDVHASFKLSKSGGIIGIFAPDSTAIDFVSYSTQTSDVSDGRFPDGSGQISALPLPTPNAANIGPNTAPVLAFINDKVLTLGQTLTLAIQATDADQPPQTLFYTLSADSPQSATLNPLNGILTWRPTALGNTDITVNVTDNGVPSLSASQTFTVTVAPVPRLNAALSLAAPGQLAFTWQSTAGQACQVEYTDNLGSGVWTPLIDPIPGTGQPLTATTDTSATQRFYRLTIK